ncbi:hypothetical protein LDENG_00293790, partial [Lucifuga dentata]
MVIKDQTCAPTIELREAMEGEEGSDVSIVAKVSGCPFPTLTWQKASLDTPEAKATVQYDQHVSKLVTQDKCTLLIQQASRLDSALYSLTAANSLGTATKDIRLSVLGPPGPPVGPIKFTEVFAERIGLAWNPPISDGGSKITNYVVEKREDNRKSWVHVSNDPKECIYVVTRLTENHEYEFRVMAQNKFGMGPPLVSEAEKARNLFTIPGQCDKPTVTEICLESMTVNWDEPKYDGGSPITGYFVEKKETTAKRWTRVTREPIRALPLGNNWDVMGLLEGAMYQFRVIAVNAAGCGLPSMPSDPVLCRDPIKPPGPPTPKVTDWTKSTVELEWLPPLVDGGSKVTGYIIELKEVNKEEEEKKAQRRLLLSEGEEEKEGEADEGWKKAKDTEVRGTRLVVDGLKEGGLYRFRVRAVNAAGTGEPGLVSELIELRDRTIAPEMDLDASVKEKIVVHAGATIRIIAYVSGKPAPQITWCRDDGEVPKEAAVEKTGISNSLVIKNCKRQHQGIYTLSAKNKGGERKKAVIVEVLDVPGPVGLPFTGENLTNDSCRLTWYSPEDDGGSAITNYIIEKRESDRMGWTSVSYTVTRNNAVVQGLLDGKGYFFRIAAENIIGMGPFIETDKMVLIKDPISIPERPEDLIVTAVTKDSISVAWRPPKYDGGAEVTAYILQSRMVGCDSFTRVGGDDNLMDRKFTLTGLKDGSSHEFRVSAVNQVGQGKPSFCTKPIQCKDEVEPPTLDLDFRDKMMVKVGDVCTLQGRYGGKPTPTITWTKNDEELKAEDEVSVHSTARHLSLTISKAKREHSGCYCVSVDNAAGARRGICTVTVVDRPQPPEGPVVFNEVCRNYMVVSWNPPLDDGGCAVSNYIIERRDTNRDLWMPVTASCTRTSCRVPKLIEGRDYIIRIMAQNIYGISDLLLSAETKARDIFRVPDAPKQPTVKDVCHDSALISWEPPADGGKPITGYIVERKETMANRWVRCNTEPVYPSVEYLVTELLQGCEYEFRVSAENMVGAGDPSPPSKPVFAKDPIVKPGPPVNLEAVNYTKESVTLSWEPPTDTGRGKIFGYLLEFQKAGEEEWQKV